MFAWTEELATGNQQIDDQHKEIFRKADNVFQLTDEENADKLDEEQLTRTFKFLVSYMFEHFNDEEKLMQEHNYSDIVNHKAEHTAFIKKVSKLNKKLKEQGVDSEFVTELKFIIIELLVEHIDETDKKFVSTLNNPNPI